MALEAIRAAAAKRLKRLKRWYESYDRGQMKNEPLHPKCKPEDRLTPPLFPREKEIAAFEERHASRDDVPDPSLFFPTFDE